MVAGGLGATLRFMDGLGRLSVPVMVKTISFTQHDRLQSTLTLDILAIDRDQLLAAKAYRDNAARAAHDRSDQARRRGGNA
jgi:hypothetical protein